MAPVVPTASTLGEAVSAVLDGVPQVRVGSMLVSAVDGGCSIKVKPDSNLGDVGLAIMHLNAVRACVRGTRLSVRVHFWATVEKSWILPGGVRRITHPGFSDLYNEFRTEREVRAWLGSARGRAMVHSPTFHWSISTLPRRRL